MSPRFAGSTKHCQSLNPSASTAVNILLAARDLTGTFSEQPDNVEFVRNMGFQFEVNVIVSVKVVRVSDDKPGVAFYFINRSQLSTLRTRA